MTKMQRLFVELLNRTLRAQLDPMLTWSRPLRLYYFPPDGAGIDRTIRYRSLKNETSRAVVKAKRRKRREQGRGAFAFVVMRHRPAAALLHRQPRLGAVKGLDWALFIDRQH
jgi:hypothetical protein